MVTPWNCETINDIFFHPQQSLKPHLKKKKNTYLESGAVKFCKCLNCMLWHHERDKGKTFDFFGQRVYGQVDLC